MPMPPKAMAFFAHERGDARVIKRIRAFGDLGWRVTGFTFHRVRDREDVPPAWENVHLGVTYNRRYFQRLGALGRSLGVLWRNRRRLRDCGVIYAVNTDNAALALFGRWLAGGRAPLVLELADVQPVMTGRGIVSKVARAMERAVLRRSALLVTTSPGFVREYFHGMQGYGGRIFLLENKVYPGAELPEAEFRAEPVHGGKPWVVGCFGAFRCRRSLELMAGLAKRLEGNVRFLLRGYAAGTIEGDFAAWLGNSPGVVYGGAYAYPGDLAEMYGAVDMNWCIDESARSGNSAWLLPNRIYEGGCFGVPALAGADTETGRWVGERRAGWVLAEPLGESLEAFFRDLSVEEWREVRRRCGVRPREEFTGEADYTELSGLLEEIRGRQAAGPP